MGANRSKDKKEGRTSKMHSMHRGGLHIRMQERVNERTRIARDLHDTLLQSFQGVVLKLAAVPYVIQHRPAEAAGMVERIAEQARQAVTEGRDAIFWVALFYGIHKRPYKGDHHVRGRSRLGPTWGEICIFSRGPGRCLRGSRSAHPGRSISDRSRSATERISARGRQAD